MEKTGRKIKVKVIPCEVYSRVVGYFRPVSNWNPGKQREFKERKLIDPKKLKNDKRLSGDIFN
ncbi:MAG: hypothetical protein DRQ03_04010 [Candidatus Hydrothermota bacterium]|nr:hypothetical protein [Candidatus Hydrothermae bacterium]RKY97861.1 MAG: hypothetical protein DRQ03_04010 [Candidatus Hydrothermae bacterium]